MLEASAGQLAKSSPPSAIFVADGLPRNAMGKVQKNHLRDQHKDTFAAAAP